jgi:hypothetical protein
MIAPRAGLSESDRIRGQFGSRQLRLLPNRFDIPALVPRDSVEVVPRVLAWPIARRELPNLRSVRRRLATDVFEVGKQQSCRADWVVSCGSSHDQREVGLSKDGHLARKVQNVVVVRDESVPRPLVVVEGEQNFPVIYVRRQRYIDLPKRNKLGLGYEVVQRVDDRFREVLVERKERQATMRRRGGCG